jgi:hypothetical protein
MIGRARNLDALSILDIYTALGGHLSPRSAGKHEAEGTCWGPHSHGSDHYNLRLNNEKGTWACHCQGERGGGGKLDLIALAGHSPNGDPKAAVEWLIAQGLLHEPERTNGNRPTVVATFRYEHEDHVLIAKVERVEPGRNSKPKEFFPYLWEGTKYAKTSSLKDRKLPLYRLPELRRAIDAEERIFLVEGEGKADKLRDALRAAGIAGAITTLFGGAPAKLTEEHLYQLRGLKSLDIIADSDAPGRKAARTRAEQIAQLGVTVKLLDPALLTWAS